MLKKLLILTLVLGLAACIAESPLTTRSTAPQDKGVERVSPAIIHTPTTAKKVALIIGNKNYQFGRLRNTVNDAADMARVLNKIGFDEVILKTNLDQRGMDEALDQFRVRLVETRGIGFFYFSGHGARAGGENYLLPINNDQIKKAKDLKYYALASSRVLETMKNAKTDLNIIVLDACRDNPFRSAGKTLNRGLSRMQGRGSIIAFATAEKDTASDISNNQRNGLFTSHLLAALTNAQKTHQRIDDMFMQVSQAVFRESGGQQEPWYNASWRAPFCFGGCSVTKPKPVVEPTTPVVVPELSFFRDTLSSGGKGPEMVRIPAGSFRMGDIQGGGGSDEKPVHLVSVSAFAMGKYEVTVGEYLGFVKATDQHAPAWMEKGSKYNTKTGSDNHYKKLESALTNKTYPVVGVSWHDAVAYAKWLSQQTGHTYRLPTEAEWEYAARAGTTIKYWWGNKIGSNKANCDNSYCGDSFEYTAPVGSFGANQFGIYDTVGNVWEWTCSEYKDKYQGSETICKNSSNWFVLRGGSWYSSAGRARSSNRGGGKPTTRDGSNGFRLVRTN